MEKMWHLRKSEKIKDRKYGTEIKDLKGKFRRQIQKGKVMNREVRKKKH